MADTRRGELVTRGYMKERGLGRPLSHACATIYLVAVVSCLSHRRKESLSWLN